MKHIVDILSLLFHFSFFFFFSNATATTEIYTLSLHDAIPISFVDVMLVLLIIFMVAAPLLTAGVPLELPQAKGKALEANKQPIVVSVIKSGEVYLGEETKKIGRAHV